MPKTKNPTPKPPANTEESGQLPNEIVASVLAYNVALQRLQDKLEGYFVGKGIDPKTANIDTSTGTWKVVKPAPNPDPVDPA